MLLAENGFNVFFGEFNGLYLFGRAPGVWGTGFTEFQHITGLIGQLLFCKVKIIFAGGKPGRRMYAMRVPVQQEDYYQ